MKAINQLVVITFSLILMSGECHVEKMRNCIHQDLKNSKIEVEIKDKITQRNIYSDSTSNPIYPIDSLKIVDLTGNPLAISTYYKANGNYPHSLVISFGTVYNSQTDASSFTTEICKYFVLKYKYNEADTIKACFKSETTDCGSQFDRLRVYHKENHLATVDDAIKADIILFKGQ